MGQVPSFTESGSHASTAVNQNSLGKRLSEVMVCRSKK